MSHIITTILFALMAVMGGVSSLAIIIMIPVVIVQKIIGVVRYGKKITD